MSTRLLLEGPDIEALLQRIREEHGEDAHIVAAERIRTGGIAGFFAKQRYEVAVEVELDEPLGPVVLPAETAAEIAAERDAAGVADAAKVTDAESADAAPAGAPAPWTEAAEQAVGLEGLDPAMVLALRVQDQASLAGRPVASWPGPRPTAGPAPRHGGGAAGARPNHPGAEVTRLDQRPVRLLTPVGPGLRSAVVVPAITTSEPAGAPRAPRAAGDVLVIVGDGAPAHDVALRLAQTLRLPSSRVLVASPDPVVPGLHASRRISDAAGARVAGAKLAAGTSAAIVVVDAPVSAACEPDLAQWVRDVSGALGATAVWAAVDATRRTADTHRWLAAVGPVTALAAYHVEATSDPTELFNLGVPVALLDGRRATASAWTTLSGTVNGTGRRAMEA